MKTDGRINKVLEEHHVIASTREAISISNHGKVKSPRGFTPRDDSMKHNRNIEIPPLQRFRLHPLEKGLAIALALFSIFLLLAGEPTLRQFVFYPDLVIKGQWWRMLLHPFTHVSGYHLALDGTVFLMLYHSLHTIPWKQRLGLVALCGMGSMLLPLALSPGIWSIGLCGLSGIDHGLMTILALEMMKQAKKENEPKLFRIGLASLILVSGKALLEILTGGAFFASSHMGDVGIPIVACHGGGVLGGILGYTMIYKRFVTPPCRERQSSPAPDYNEALDYKADLHKKQALKSDLLRSQSF